MLHSTYISNMDHHSDDNMDHKKQAQITFNLFHFNRHRVPNTPVTPESRCHCGASTALTAVAPPWSPWLRSGSVIDRRSTAENCQNRGPSTPSHRRRGAIAMLVRHKPQWHRHDRHGSAVVPSLIAVAPRKTFKTADLRGGTAETLNMFKTSVVPPRVGPISVWSPRHRHYRRGTAMTAVAPCKDRSSTSITAVPPQYNRRAIATK